MYQIKFGPLYHITYTTHPLIISLGEKCIQIILGNTVTVQRPFSNDTKAEMVAKWRGEDKSIIANSFSCQKNLRFASKRGNCGECYACLVRRLSLLITGDPTIYEVKNISDIKELKQELWPILNFSVRMLINYDSLDYWQKKNIEKYHKKELFEKFAKDTILAIKMLSKKEKLPDWSLDLLSKASDYLLENCK